MLLFLFQMHQLVYSNEELCISYLFVIHVLRLWFFMGFHNVSSISKDIPYTRYHKAFRFPQIQYTVVNSFQCSTLLLCAVWLLGQCKICLDDRLPVHPCVIYQWQPFNLCSTILLNITQEMTITLFIFTFLQIAYFFFFFFATSIHILLSSNVGISFRFSNSDK